MIDALKTAAAIATPFGLLGFGMALSYFLRVRRMKHDEAMLDKLPPEERARHLDDSLRKYSIDASNATREQKVRLIRDEMDRKFRLSRLYTIVLAAVVTVCFALAAFSPSRNSGGSGSGDTIHNVTNTVNNSLVIANNQFGDFRFALINTVVRQVEEQGKPELAAEVRKASEAIANNDYPQARLIYEKLAQSVPTPDIRNNLGVLQAMTGQPEQALESFQKATGSDLAAGNLKTVESPRPGSSSKETLLGWQNNHPPGFDGAFQFAKLVTNPAEPQEAYIREKGERHFYKLFTGDAKGKLKVIFEPTGITRIKPGIWFLYEGKSPGGGVDNTPGARLPYDFEIDGSGQMAYIGVWSNGDDESSEVPYRLHFSLSDGQQWQDPSAAKPRFAIGDVGTKESEPNDHWMTANEMKLESLAAGQIATKGDVDYFKIPVPADAAGLAVTLQQLDYSPLRAAMKIYNANGSKIGGSAWGYGGQGLDLDVSVKEGPAGGEYYVAVSDSDGDISTKVPYVIRVGLMK